MRLRHLLPAASCRHTVSTDEGRAFFLSNPLGDFVSLYTTNQSRYAGWFQKTSGGFYKLLESVELLQEGEPQAVSLLTNTGQAVFWEYEKGQQLGWKLVADRSGLTITLSQTCQLRLSLDLREMYRYPTWERQYLFSEDDAGLMLAYTDPLEPGPVYLHLRSNSPFRVLNEWREQHYPRDTTRHSEPSRLFVLLAAEVSTDLIGLGAGSTPAAAREASLAAFRQTLTMPEIGISHHQDTLLNEVAAAKYTVKEALKWLQTPEGIYAGLPWFHQVWTRDELITALGYPAQERLEVIQRYARPASLRQGELPTYIGSDSFCADGVGWLCLLLKEYGPLNLPEAVQKVVLEFLGQTRKQLREQRQAAHGLISSEPNATWMDTIGRSGFRLEIQTMYALLLEILFALSDNSEYERERLGLLGRIKQYFWQKNYLKDGLADSTLRPNLFLAYLLQPDLLSTYSWQLCFDTALKALLCPWGGLSSLEQSNPAFQAHSSGEDNQSYHQGDSWFFINNLAAIALHRFNPSRYGRTVVGILQSATEEILWQNMVGQPGEISSAAALESFGCGIQAFSGGTYLALLQELERYNPPPDGEAAAFWEG